MDQQDYRGVTGDIVTVESGERLMYFIWLLRDDRNGVSTIAGPGGTLVQSMVSPQIALALLDVLASKREELKALVAQQQPPQ